jgi:hypothetical protein
MEKDVGNNNKKQEEKSRKEWKKERKMFFSYSVGFAFWLCSALVPLDIKIEPEFKINCPLKRNRAQSILTF